MTPQARLLEILTLLTLTPKEDRCIGICIWVSMATKDLPEDERRAIDRTMKELMQAWPDALTSRIYVVPMERGNTSMQDAAYAYNNLPRWTKGPYAELRCELLQWMIKELTNA